MENQLKQEVEQPDLERVERCHNLLLTAYGLLSNQEYVGTQDGTRETSLQRIEFTIPTNISDNRECRYDVQFKDYKEIGSRGYLVYIEENI